MKDSIVEIKHNHYVRINENDGTCKYKSIENKLVDWTSL